MTRCYHFNKARCVEISGESGLVDHGQVTVRTYLPNIKLETPGEVIDTRPIIGLLRSDGKEVRVRGEWSDGEDKAIQLPILTESGSEIWLGEAAIEKSNERT